MIRVSDIEVFNFEGAIRGMRNPMNSWDKSDTILGEKREDGLWKYVVPQIGKNDLELMQKLFKAGTEHRKFMRQIFVSMDITAPIYWWKEADTYTIGVTKNSCSTMHKLPEKEFTLDDFSIEHLKDCESVGCDEFLNFDCGRAYTPMDSMVDTIKMLNKWRLIYLNNGKTKSAWWQMIQLLPSSYNQKRTVTMNYENAASMIKQRENHKLDEWHDFVKVLKDLPYMKQIMMLEE